MQKAPCGGMTSPVNGEDYLGGQFVPETGEFCGRGTHRIAKGRLDAINAGLSGLVIRWSENHGLFQVVKTNVVFANGVAGESVLLSSPSLKTAEKAVRLMA